MSLSRITVHGTNHFISHAKAVKFYKDYYPDFDQQSLEYLVSKKIANDEIVIGIPAAGHKQRVSVMKDGCRYQVATKRSLSK